MISIFRRASNEPIFKQFGDYRAYPYPNPEPVTAPTPRRRPAPPIPLGIFRRIAASGVTL